MNFAAIAPGTSLFVDANVLVYHFSADAAFGPACTDLVKRIERQEIRGFTSTHALIDVAHRLMTLEAIMDFGWPVANIARRLRRHHSEIPKLLRYRQAIDVVPQIGFHVLPVTVADVISATSISGLLQLLTGDSLVVTVMQAAGLSVIASNDADFDRVNTLTRYGPT